MGRLLRTEDPATVGRILDHHRRDLAEQLADYERALRLLPTPDRWCEDSRKERSVNAEPTTYRCSFCRKTNDRVFRMIAGPNDVHICHECVPRCNDILVDAKHREATA